MVQHVSQSRPQASSLLLRSARCLLGKRMHFVSQTSHEDPRCLFSVRRRRLGTKHVSLEGGGERETLCHQTKVYESGSNATRILNRYQQYAPKKETLEQCQLLLTNVCERKTSVHITKLPKSYQDNFQDNSK